MNASPKTSFTLASIVFLLAGASQAATIAAGGTDHLVAGNVNDYYTVSVNDGLSGYGNLHDGGPNSGSSITGSFAQTIISYRFVNVTGGPGARTLNTVVESGGRIAQMTSTDESDNNGFDSFGQNRLNGYTTSTPNNFFGEASPTVARNFTAGIRDLDDFSGTVDISGQQNGSLYLIYGRFNTGGLSLTASLTGASAPIINSGQLFTGPSAVSGQNIYVTRIDFRNAVGYDTLTFTSDGSRLVGAVLTVPEPSSMALLGLGSLALCLSRRR